MTSKDNGPVPSSATPGARPVTDNRSQATTPLGQTPLLEDPAEIRRALAVLVAPGGVVELRALKVDRAGTVIGFFNDLDRLASAARSVAPKAAGVYVVLNEINPALLSRAANRVIERAEGIGTKDHEIVRRRWLPIDLDPVRPAGVLSSDEEHQLALARAKAVRSFLSDKGWPTPLLASSGNGAHLLYRIDLPTDDGNVVTRALTALSAKFSDSRVKLDTSVGNPARIWRLYGVVNRKGDAIPGRPRRRAEILDVPATLEVAPGSRGAVMSPEELAPVPPPRGEGIVPSSLVEALAAEACEPSTGTTSRPKGSHSIEGDGVRGSPVGDQLVARIRAHGLALYRDPHTDSSGRTIYPLSSCPFSPDHVVGSAAFIVMPSGARVFRCQHDSCKARRWRDVVKLWEDRPGKRLESPAPDGCDAHGAKWSPPRPLGAAKSTVPAFPMEVLPSWLRDWVDAVRESFQVPADLPGLLALVVMAVACAKRFRVEAKPGWREPLNLFVMIALEPGNRKSAVFREAVAPLLAFEAEEAARLAPDIAQARVRREVVAERLKTAKRAATGGERSAEADRLAIEYAECRIPTAPRLFADDVTPEKVPTLLGDNDGRFALLSAEGGVFETVTGRYQQGAPNLDILLKGHAGDPIRVERVNRPPDVVDSPALTVGVTVQPAVVVDLCGQPAFRARGVLARFVFAVPQSPLGTRTDPLEAPPVPENVREAFARNVSALLRLTPQEDGNPRTLSLTSEARSLLSEFHAWLEPQLGPMGALTGLKDWAGKLAGLILRFAGLLHVAKYADAGSDGRPIEISAETFRSAHALGKYALSHATLVLCGNRTLDNARRMLGWLEEYAVPVFSEREVLQKLKGSLRNMEAVRAAITTLSDHGYLRPAPAAERSGPGRSPGASYEVHPQVWDPAAAADPSATETDRATA